MKKCLNESLAGNLINPPGGEAGQIHTTVPRGESGSDDGDLLFFM